MSANMVPCMRLFDVQGSLRAWYVAGLSWYDGAEVAARYRMQGGKEKRD